MIVLGGFLATDRARGMERIRVAANGQGFELADSGQTFVPWGFNYDHDEDQRLIEQYWETEWPRVAADFAEMRALGANTVRVHLQFGAFMESSRAARPAALERLQDLLKLAEQEGLYLDLTGLGCYLKADVPPWYDALPESERWQAQAAFWSAVADVCAGSPAVFCYDLMNEPVAPGGVSTDWLGPPFAGKFHFVQRIALDQAGRKRPEIARQWLANLVAAIRPRDPERLITVGLVDWSLDRPGLTSGFEPAVCAAELDFLCVHLYPEAGKGQEALETLRGFQTGKPLVIEETFPLKAGAAEFRQFLKDSRGLAHGCLGFYWGKTAAECRASGTLADAFMLSWLEIFGQERWSAAMP